MGNIELVALLTLSSWCLVMDERLFLAVPWGCLRFVIVVFSDHTHLLFLCAFLQTKDRKHIEQNYHSLAVVMPQGWDLGCWWVKNFFMGICDGGPLTAHFRLQIKQNKLAF